MDLSAGLQVLCLGQCIISQSISANCSVHTWLCIPLGDVCGDELEFSAAKAIFGCGFGCRGVLVDDSANAALC